MKLSEAISLRVNNLLKENNVNQYYLYKKGGIPRSTVSEIINNKRQNITLDTLYQVCSTLDITLTEFFSDKLFDIENI